MAITRATASSITQGLPKNKSVLSGNLPILGGSYESIATYTVGTGGVANVTFSSIPQTYKHLQIRAFARDLRASTWIDTLWLYCNSDVTGTNYVSQLLVGNGSSVSAANDAGVTNYGTPIGLTTATNVTTAFSPNIIEVLDYTNTNKNKTFRSLNGVEDNTNGSTRLRSGLWMSTAAITSITLRGD